MNQDQTIMYNESLKAAEDLKIQVELLNSKLKKYEDMDIDLLIKEHDRLAQKVLDSWPKCCECEAGLGSNLRCTSCYIKKRAVL
tara:strand:+ start:200 stop:451 length:252 start_codon:yes stop_codon:yes gene_type:complete